MEKTVLALRLLVLVALHLCALQTAESAPQDQSRLFASPLFGSPGGGDPFDDGITAIVPHAVRITSLNVCYGDAVDGIQVNYTLEDGKTLVGFSHGVTEKCAKKLIEFKEGESIVHIEGKTQATYGYISQLTLFTVTVGGLPSTYGPFGLGGDSHEPFSATGAAVGFFGRAGQVLDALGLYINPNSVVAPTSYKKTDLIGGGGGDGFDDFLSDSEKPFKITNILVNYGSAINGIQVTYLLPSGSSSTILHGVLSRDNWQYDGILDFDDDEWITQVDISSGPSHIVDYLQVRTTDSKGSVRSYGPFGKVFMGNVTTVHGVVYGFFGRCGNQLDALGFYI